MMYVTFDGGIYRFGQARFRQYLALMARNKPVQITDFATFVAVPQHDFSKLTPDQARDILIDVLTKEDKL